MQVNLCTICMYTFLEESSLAGLHANGVIAAHGLARSKGLGFGALDHCTELLHISLTEPQASLCLMQAFVSITDKYLAVLHTRNMCVHHVMGLCVHAQVKYKNLLGSSSEASELPCKYVDSDMSHERNRRAALN